MLEEYGSSNKHLKGPDNDSVEALIRISINNTGVIYSKIPFEYL